MSFIIFISKSKSSTFLLTFLYSTMILSTLCSNQNETHAMDRKERAAIPKGLYKNSEGINVFDPTKWETLVKNEKSIDWLVEFYHSNCGYCIQYAPVFKQFAKLIEGWSSLVKVGVFDCAAHYKFCSTHGVGSFPTLKFLPATSKNKTGTIIKTLWDVSKLQQAVINLIKKEPHGKNLNVVLKVENIPNDPALVIFSSGTSSQSAIITLHGKTKLPVFWSNDMSYTDKDFFKLGLWQNSNMRIISSGRIPSIKEMISLIMSKYGKEEMMKPTTRKTITKNPDSMDSKVLGGLDSETVSTNKVNSIDLYSGISMALYGDLSLHRNFGSAEHMALKKFITVLDENFPGNPQMMTSLGNLKRQLQTTSFTYRTGPEWVEAVNISKLPRVDRVWVTCRGSDIQYRGYPCSLWTLFHSLTVISYNRNPQAVGADSRNVLDAMNGFIVNLYSCSYCGKNFAKEAVGLSSSVKTSREAVLWLWRVHNSVNRRLEGKQSEDPLHPKVPFPTAKQCPACYTIDGQEFKEAEVFDFLVGYYSPMFWESSRDHLDTREEGKIASVGAITFTDLIICVVVGLLCTSLSIAGFYIYCQRRRSRGHSNHRGHYSPAV